MLLPVHSEKGAPGSIPGAPVHFSAVRSPLQQRSDSPHAAAAIETGPSTGAPLSDGSNYDLSIVGTREPASSRCRRAFRPVEPSYFFPLAFESSTVTRIGVDVFVVPSFTGCVGLVWPDAAVA